MTALTLRTGRLYWLARYFEQHPREYNQANYCGTGMCVGGLAVWQWGTEAHRREIQYVITKRGRVPCTITFSRLGQGILGLTRLQKYHLFAHSPFWLTSTGPHVQQVKEVVATLRHLARTGEVLTSPPDVSGR